MNLSFLAGYLWIIPLLCLIGVTVFYFLGKKQEKQGVKNNYIVYTVSCVIAFIGSLLWMWFDK
jgi:heme/copper-type cytochrome/quinol oxidase subunit 4